MADARILHTSDVHLGASCSGWGDLAERRREEVRDAFEWLGEETIRRRAAALVVAGDLFDGPQPGDRDRELVRRVGERLRNAGSRLVVIPGNHDGIGRGHTVYDRPDAAEVLGAEVLLEPGRPAVFPAGDGRVAVHGWLEQVGRDPLADGVGPADDADWNILLLHRRPAGDAAGDAANVLTFDPDGPASRFDCVALGDRHQWQPVREDPPMTWCGSPAPCRFHPHEAGPRRAALVELGDGATVRPIPVPGPLPVAVEVPVDDCDDAEAVSAAVAQAVSDAAAEAADGDQGADAAPPDVRPLVRLTGRLEFPLDVGALEADLVDAHGAARVRDRTELWEEGLVRRLRGEDTVVGIFLRLLDARLDGGEITEAEHDRALKLGVSLFRRAEVR